VVEAILSERPSIAWIQHRAITTSMTRTSAVSEIIVPHGSLGHCIESVMTFIKTKCRMTLLANHFLQRERFHFAVM
jgi:hypothetical protein